jgi:hypothetical protein
MIFFGFVFGERRVLWLRPVESALRRAGRVPNLAVLLALVLIVGIAEADARHRMIILLSGLAGLAVYLLVNGAAQFFLAPTGPVQASAARSAVFLFLYLEVLDASFSFDGVIGAFALSRNVIAIAAGLGIGALFVRSLTVQLVRRGVITEYVYLEHGAHWAIGVLAVTMLLRLHHTITVNSTATGLIGVAFIAAAFLSSLRARRHVPAHARRSRAFRLRHTQPQPHPRSAAGAQPVAAEPGFVPWAAVEKRAVEKKARPVRRGLFSMLVVTGLTAATVPGFALLVRTAAPEIELHTPGRVATTPAPVILPSPTTPSTATAAPAAVSLPTVSVRVRGQHALRRRP